MGASVDGGESALGVSVDGGDSVLERAVDNGEIEEGVSFDGGESELFVERSVAGDAVAMPPGTGDADVGAGSDRDGRSVSDSGSQTD